MESYIQYQLSNINLNFNEMKNYLLTIVAFFLVQNSFAQESFSELVNLPEKKLDKAIHIWGKTEWRPDTKYGCSIDPDLSQIEIKKVALVSFTISISHIFTESHLTTDGNKYFVNKLYDGSIETLKETFKKNGIELITKENMTEDQLAILSGAQAKDKIIGTSLDIKQAKLESTYENVEKKGASAGIAVEGYKNWTSNDQMPLSFDLNLFGALTNALGVDAIIFVNNIVTPDSKTLIYNKTIITMFGENPIKKVEGKKYPGMSYMHGLPYGQTSINTEFEIATFKKKAIQSENLDGYDKVITLLIDKMVEYLKINTQKSKEKYEKDHN
ncbi:hypothetical protein ACFL6I_12235 [candidate division KSB1 bacterium]